MSAQPDTAALDRLINERLDALLPGKLAALKAAKTPSMTIIATKGTLDWAYPPFILASTAGAMGWDVSMFFTFYGLGLLRKDISDLKVSPLGNPGMPMKMPFGPDWFKSINWNIPNAVQAVVPGFETMATSLMKQTIHNKGVAGVAELGYQLEGAAADLVEAMLRGAAAEADVLHRRAGEDEAVGAR